MKVKNKMFVAILALVALTVRESVGSPKADKTSGNKHLRKTTKIVENEKIVKVPDNITKDNVPHSKNQKHVLSRRGIHNSAAAWPGSYSPLHGYNFYSPHFGVPSASGSHLLNPFLGLKSIQHNFGGVPPLLNEWPSKGHGVTLGHHGTNYVLKPGGAVVSSLNVIYPHNHYFTDHNINPVAHVPSSIPVAAIAPVRPVVTAGTLAPPVLPAVPVVPNIPLVHIPNIPHVVTAPSIPSVPSIPSIPPIPSIPSIPSAPSVPSVPSVPQVPTITLPVAPGFHPHVPTLGMPSGPSFNPQVPAFAVPALKPLPPIAVPFPSPVNPTPPSTTLPAAPAQPNFPIFVHIIPPSRPQGTLPNLPGSAVLPLPPTPHQPSVPPRPETGSGEATPQIPSSSIPLPPSPSEQPWKPIVPSQNIPRPQPQPQPHPHPHTPLQPQPHPQPQPTPVTPSSNRPSITLLPPFFGQPTGGEGILPEQIPSNPRPLVPQGYRYEIGERAESTFTEEEIERAIIQATHQLQQHQANRGYSYS